MAGVPEKSGAPFSAETSSNNRYAIGSRDVCKSRDSATLGITATANSIVAISGFNH